MAITAPPTIPQITDPATFAERAQDWVVWQADEFYPFITDTSAIIGLSTSGTSTTSNTVGTGAKTFTTQTGKGFLAGQSLVIARTSDPATQMRGIVTSYNTGTGSLGFTSQAFDGSGTYTDWTITQGFAVTSIPQDESVIAISLADSAIHRSSIINGYVVVSTVGSAYIITLVTEAGLTPSVDDPVIITFRGATLTNARFEPVKVISALTITIQNGSTLGTISGIENNIQVLFINNAGTVELAVVNNTGALQLNEFGLINTTALNSGSDSANVIYSTAARLNVAYRNVQYLTNTQATAGVWNSAPTVIQPYINSPSWAGAAIYEGELTSSATSATIYTITNIPAWARRITIIAESTSTNGTSNLMVQIGDSGGLEVTTYDSNAALINAASVTVVNFSSGFGITPTTVAASIYTWTMVLNRQNPLTNTWEMLMTGNVGTSLLTCHGIKSLSAQLDRFALTTVAGANTFDGGSFKYFVE